MNSIDSKNAGLWLNSIRFYVLLVTLLNGVWETLQMPLYTLWRIVCHQNFTVFLSQSYA